MNETDKLKKLMSLCKCSVSIEVNGHRDYYQTAEQGLADIDSHECPPDINEDVRKIMIETDTIIRVHFYPNTPIGCYDICHYDLDACLDMALSCFKEEEDGGK